MEHEEKGNRELIRAHLASGALPRFGSQPIFAGNGDMQPCVCCNGAITPKDIQYDVVLADEGVLFMHLECFNLWCEESRL
jgi:hypothetical protein